MNQIRTDWLKPQPIQFSPFDLRLALRILISLLAWGLLSVDYSSLATFAGSSTSPASLSLTNQFGAALFASPRAIQALQIASAVLLILAAWRVSRLSLAVGIVGPLLLEWHAYAYRGQLYNIDMTVALLTIALLLPYRWKNVFGTSRAPTYRATVSGRAMATYAGVAYFLCGYSKLATVGWDWWQQVHLELVYQAMHLWHNSSTPATMRPVTLALDRLFNTYPALAEALALFALLAELLWITVLWSRIGRRIVPWSMFLVHVGIFLVSGINFLTIGVAALVLIIPWRDVASPITLVEPGPAFPLSRLTSTLRYFNWLRLVRFATEAQAVALRSPSAAGTPLAVSAHHEYRGSEALVAAMMRCPLLAMLLSVPGSILLARKILQRMLNSNGASVAGGSESELDRIKPFKLGARSAIQSSVILIAGILAVFPALLANHYFPFANYNQFGWSYKLVAEENTVYRLGYFDRDARRIRPMPMNYGGFTDFRWIGMTDSYVRVYATAQNDFQRMQSVQILQQYQAALRPHHSNRWLLGALAMPDHVVSDSPEITLESFSELYLMEGRSRLLNGRIHIDWRVMGQLPDVQVAQLDPVPPRHQVKVLSGRPGSDRF